MLRVAVHFAAINIGLRHVIDWRIFVALPRPDRLEALYAAARDAGMTEFLNCLNAICVDYLGLDTAAVPVVRNADLEGVCWTKSSVPHFRIERRQGPAASSGSRPPLVDEPLETLDRLQREHSPVLSCVPSGLYLKRP